MDLYKTDRQKNFANDDNKFNKMIRIRTRTFTDTSSRKTYQGTYHTSNTIIFWLSGRPTAGTALCDVAFVSNHE
jgi:hypothetical protein